MRYPFVLILALILPCAPSLADVTLSWRAEQPGVDGKPAVHHQTWRIAGRWIRIDRDDRPEWLLLDSGYLLLHRIDPRHKRFSVFGPSTIHAREGLAPIHKGGALHGNYRKPSELPSPPMRLRGSAEIRHVIGKPCRKVEALRDGKPVAVHCMADARQLGLSEREMISATRVIKFAHRLTDPNWVAGQSGERFLSLDSQALPQPGARFTLEKIDYRSLPTQVFRIPRDYRKEEPRGAFTGLFSNAPAPAQRPASTAGSPRNPPPTTKMPPTTRSQPSR